MTREQREKIAETMGALYIVSAYATEDDLKGVIATYADDLAYMLEHDEVTE